MKPRTQAHRTHYSVRSSTARTTVHVSNSPEKHKMAATTAQRPNRRIAAGEATHGMWRGLNIPFTNGMHVAQCPRALCLRSPLSKSNTSRRSCTYAPSLAWMHAQVHARPLEHSKNATSLCGRRYVGLPSCGSIRPPPLMLEQSHGSHACSEQPRTRARTRTPLSSSLSTCHSRQALLTGRLSSSRGTRCFERTKHLGLALLACHLSQSTHAISPSSSSQLTNLVGTPCSLACVSPPLPSRPTRPPPLPPPLPARPTPPNSLPPPPHMPASKVARPCPVARDESATTLAAGSAHRARPCRAAAPSRSRRARG